MRSGTGIRSYGSQNKAGSLVLRIYPASQSVVQGCPADLRSWVLICENLRVKAKEISADSAGKTLDTGTLKKNTLFPVTFSRRRSFQSYNLNKSNAALNPLTDNALMLKVKAGDLDKMGLLFERHHRRLYGFLFHATYNKENAEDMVQQVFYKMLKYRNSFTGSGEFIAWMFVVARNVLKDQGRKKKLAMHKEGVEEFADMLPGGVSPQELLEKKQSHSALYRAMEKLNDDQREILALSRFQELKTVEIAGILGMTEVAVRTRVHRAMHELKSIFIKMEFKHE